MKLKPGMKKRFDATAEPTMEDWQRLNQQRITLEKKHKRELAQAEARLYEVRDKLDEQYFFKCAVGALSAETGIDKSALIKHYEGDRKSLIEGFQEANRKPKPFGIGAPILGTFLGSLFGYIPAATLMSDSTLPFSQYTAGHWLAFSMLSIVSSAGFLWAGCSTVKQLSKRNKQKQKAIAFKERVVKDVKALPHCKAA